MQYIKRHLECKFTKISHFFKAVLVTGARQVGKTTMLPETLMHGAASGHFFENYVVTELLKSYSYSPSKVTDNIKTYKWSNYKDYIEKNQMTDIDFVLNLFNAMNREKAVKNFIEYI